MLIECRQKFRHRVTRFVLSSTPDFSTDSLYSVDMLSKLSFLYALDYNSRELLLGSRTSSWSDSGIARHVLFFFADIRGSESTADLKVSRSQILWRHHPARISG